MGGQPRRRDVRRHHRGSRFRGRRPLRMGHTGTKGRTARPSMAMQAASGCSTRTVRSTTSCSLFLRAGCDELHATQKARMTDRGAESLRAKLITALITKERSAFSRRPLPTVMTSEGGWRYCRPRCLACARERRSRRLSPATRPHGQDHREGEGTLEGGRATRVCERRGPTLPVGVVIVVSSRGGRLLELRSHEPGRGPLL